MFEKVINDGSEDPEGVVPTYHGYSASGFAQGELVYAGYGRPQDYQYLNSAGISLQGRIVLVRYGSGFRGDKCDMAAEAGAVGCLVYTDPADDGYLRGEVYPNGPWRPDDGVQRGSVWPGSGDPATPGWPSSPKAPRLTQTEASDPSNRLLTWPLIKIPTQPLSYGDAKPFLEMLAGSNPAPTNMSGSTQWLPGGYWLGPGPAVVTMNLTQDYQTLNITNVFGRILGSVEPDRIVLVGCHHDAWTYGAADPISGSTAMLEVVNAFGAMYKKGWRPRRTLMFASWDAEEYAMVGSTEFSELHFQGLTNKLVSYLNLDVAVAGTTAFTASGTPNMVDLLTKVTKMVSVPTAVKAATPDVFSLWARSGVDSNQNPILYPLGAGSDYASFLQHLGVSSLSMAFIDPNVDGYPQYHSRYDCYNYMQKFVDPSWEFHATMSKVMGLVTKAMVDSYVLPYTFTPYAIALSQGTNALSASLRPPTGVSLDFTNLFNSIAAFAEVAKKADAEAVEIVKKHNPDALLLRQLNDRLYLTERAFLDYNGLPGQPWLRHMIYAPGQSDAYSGSMFPSIVNAAAAGNWKVVQEQIGYVSLFVDAASEVLSGNTVW